MKKDIPAYSGTLRSHLLNIPESIYACSGILIFGRRIKSVVFSTDVAIIKNVNADAVIAVYPFTPQPVISQAIIQVSDVPVFVGVGGGITNGQRSVRLAAEAEHQGAFGVVVNAPIPPAVIAEMKARVDIPVIATIVSERQDIEERIAAGADILNVPIIATGGPTEESILATVQAGANAITYTPPTNGQLFSETMQKYRQSFD